MLNPARRSFESSQTLAADRGEGAARSGASMLAFATDGMAKIAVLVPCFNESMTVGRVVEDFARELPTATLYVYDNNSTDDTAAVARAAGAVVRRERRQGKGHVICSMFRDIEADIYVLVDGDCTYPPASVHALMAPILGQEADMAVGDRHALGAYGRENSRRFHSFGNGLVRLAVNRLFRAQLGDIMSGYRVFTRRFVKSMPMRAGGFEIETEMTLHGLDKSLRVVEVPIPYQERPAGSLSKLNTFRDGLRVLWTIVALFKNYKPMAFFGGLALVSSLLGLASGAPVIVEFLRTRYITHVPLAILSTGLITCGGLSLAIGLILDTVAMNARATSEALIRTMPAPQASSVDLELATF
jgi:glycosyltransferase involved in cell wall biosynthesis